MIAKASAIQHGQAMTNYATKNNRADIVKTNRLSEGLPPMGMWDEMVLHQSMFKQRYAKKPIELTSIRFELSPSEEEARNWSMEDWRSFLDEFIREMDCISTVSHIGKKKGKAATSVTPTNIANSQYFAALHRDSKSGIPHLHLVVNRIDMDGNLNDVKFIGERAVMAAKAVNQRHGWKDAMDIVLRLARELMSRGAKVQVIIQDEKDGIRDDYVLENSKTETCMGDPIPLSQIDRLSQRCMAIDKIYKTDWSRYKRGIFVHVDSRGEGEQTDVFFYNAPGSKKGKSLADNLQATFNKKYGKHQPNRGFTGTVGERDLYVLVNSQPISAFLELGNISNPKDQKRLVIPQNRQALAVWIADGVEKDYKEYKH